MRFKVDENLPVEVTELLQQAGHDASTVVEQRLGGEPDATVASLCQREKRALVTLDTDFADIRAYPPQQYPELIVLRLRAQDRPRVLDTVAHVLQAFPREQLDRHLRIVEEKRIRIRG